ncbi:hypothetical protein NPIL_154631, partial [Nephila pilipes]
SCETFSGENQGQASCWCLHRWSLIPSPEILLYKLVTSWRSHVAQGSLDACVNVGTSLTKSEARSCKPGAGMPRCATTIIIVVAIASDLHIRLWPKFSRQTSIQSTYGILSLSIHKTWKYSGDALAGMNRQGVNYDRV